MQIDDFMEDQRLPMDHRRLEKAHLQYAILNVCNWYPSEVLLKSMALTPRKLDE